MSREIPLTRGAVALVDDEDYDYLSQWCWRLNSHGYAIRSFKLDGKTRYLNMHRIVMDAQPGQFVDHIDHNRLNNTRANLRFVTAQENQRHRRTFCNNSTGYKGVSFLHDQWHVCIGLDGQMVHLGFFDDLQVAAQVYDTAARRVLAQYVVRYAGGETVRIPIRERFEVSVIPTIWGQWPFLAVPDRKDWMAERYEGQWSDSGQRQTEAYYARVHDYYLWAWRNPHPERFIETLTIEPGERKFLVAAITLGQVDEEPFYRQGRRPVKITLPQATDQPFTLEVEVDRGVATYPAASGW